MNLQHCTLVILSCFSLQGCSLFDQSPCKDTQVLESVKKQYANQININPLEKLGKITQKLGSVNSQLTEKTTSFANINLTEIQSLDLNKLKADTNQPHSQKLVELITEHFSNAEYVCQATIQQDIKANQLAELTKELSGEDSKLIKDNRLNIPVLYAVNKQANKEGYEVQYIPQNPLHLMLAIMLHKNT